MDQIVGGLLAIRHGLDFAEMSRWFITQNAAPVLGMLGGLLFRTGNPLGGGTSFTQVEAIQSYTPLVQVVADSALTLVLGWGFFRIMWAHGLRNTHTLRHMLPRACLAAVLINLSLPLLQFAVDACNALSDSISLLTRFGSLHDVTGFFAEDLLAPGLHQITLSVLFFAYVLLAFAYVIRFALLVVLAVLAPAAALLFVLPETQHYAHKWAQLFVSTLLMQPLQLLVLAIGFGLDISSHGPVGHVFALAAVYIAFKVPGALGSASGLAGKTARFAKHEAEAFVHTLAHV